MTHPEYETSNRDIDPQETFSDLIEEYHDFFQDPEGGLKGYIDFPNNMPAEVIVLKIFVQGTQTLRHHPDPFVSQLLDIYATISNHGHLAFFPFSDREQLGDFYNIDYELTAAISDEDLSFASFGSFNIGKDKALSFVDYTTHILVPAKWISRIQDNSVQALADIAGVGSYLREDRKSVV